MGQAQTIQQDHDIDKAQEHEQQHDVGLEPVKVQREPSPESDQCKPYSLSPEARNLELEPLRHKTTHQRQNTPYSTRPQYRTPISSASVGSAIGNFISGEQKPEGESGHDREQKCECASGGGEAAPSDNYGETQGK